MQKFFLFWVTFLIYQLAFSQERENNGKVYGQIIDNEGLIIPYAAVMLIKNDSIINGAYTNENGFYSIQSITEGTYSIKVEYFGGMEIINNFMLNKNENKLINVKFTAPVKDSFDDKAVEVTECCSCIYRIKKDKPSGILLYNDEIQKMADRKLSAPASLAPGVYVPIK